MIFFSRIIIIFIARESVQHFIVIVLNSPNCTSPLTEHIHVTVTDSALCGEQITQSSPSL